MDEPQKARDAAGERVAGWLAPPEGFPLAGALLLSCVLCWVLGGVDYLPTHDGPQHVYLGQLALKFGAPGTRYAEFFVPGTPITALGFFALYVPLASVFSWATALRIALVLISLGFGWGFARLVWAVHPARSALGLLGFPAALGWTLYMGFFSFQCAVALAFFTLSVALDRAPWTAARVGALAGLMLLVAVAHVFPAQLAALVLVAAFAGEAGPGRAKRWGQVLAVCAPVAAVTALAWLGRRTGAPAPGLAAELVDRPLLVLRTTVPGALWRSAPLLLAAAAGLALGWRGDARQRGLWGAGALLLAAVAGAPLSIAHWDFFFPRFTPLALALLAASIPLERLSPRGRQGVLAAAAAFGLASLAGARSLHRELLDRTQDALSGLWQPLRAEGPRLPLILDPYGGLPQRPSEQPIPYYAPLLNLGALYSAAQGGVPPRVFADTAAVHPFLLTAAGTEAFPPIPEPESLALAYQQPPPPPPQRAALLDWLSAFGTRFEDVIFWGPPDDQKRLMAHGYEARWQRGNLLLARFTGCPAAVRVELGAAEPAEVSVVYAWRSTPQMPFVERVERPRGEAVMKLRWAPCSPLLYRAQGPGLGPMVCTGAPRGEFFAVPQRGREQELVCRGKGAP